MNSQQPSYGAVECEWDIDGLTLRGLSWGEPGARPVLALHGWLDNAASFVRLAPQLRGCHVIAVDLTGQGRSSYRSRDATYQIWDDIPQLTGLLDALAWERCALLGHSRGAIIANLLAAALPERFTRVVMLDAVVPQAVAEAAFPAQLGRFVRERSHALSRDTRRYPSREQAVAARVRNGLPEEAAQALAARSLEGDDDYGWGWRIDPRLRAASAVKMSDTQIRSVLGAIQVPALLLRARGGMMQHQALLDLATGHIPQLQVWDVDGGHHFHMEPGIDSQVSGLLNFLSQDLKEL